LITIYTDTDIYKIKESYQNKYEFILQKQVIKDGDRKTEVEGYPLIIKGQRIIEYPLNNARLGLIELVITGLNALNKIKSDDLDGIDQFVQSLLVFVNQEIDADKFKELVSLGAVEINSSDPSKPADVKLLGEQLSHSETKILTDDIYNNILTICGIPTLSHKSSGGDTGQAKLLSEGWTMADERAKQDELSFKKSEKQFLKVVLRICKERPIKGSSENINKLKLSDLDIKFDRNKSDNLQVKTQGLMNMKSAEVAPDVAFSTCGLFSDPNEVYEKSKKHFGENF